MRYNVVHISGLFAAERTYPKNLTLDFFKFLAQHVKILNPLGWVSLPHPAPMAEVVVVSDDGLSERARIITLFEFQRRREAKAWRVVEKFERLPYNNVATDWRQSHPELTSTSS